ncbi:MAG: hypothetical protein IKV25_05095 [Clostridia bacterium]|nr:hypothetical protein [Clostridia bacterium]
MAKIIMIEDLLAQMDGFVTQKDVAKFIKKYKSADYLGMIMINYAEELITKNKYDIACLIYLEIDENKYLKYISDEVTLWFRLGEYYINKGEIEKGKEYLINLCNEVENYEEALGFRGLSANWQKLKPYVVDEIKPSLTLNTDADEDEPMTEDELLELFLEEMASDGLHAYLTSYGHRLEETLAAAKNKEKPLTAELLELIKTKYFKGKMPKKLETIENRIFKNDWWFEEEYDKYYYEIEKELC